MAERMETESLEVGDESFAGSLLTFADMALALEKPRVDHTYALHEITASSKALDSDCIVQREKDHNYSNVSKRSKCLEDSSVLAAGHFAQSQMQKRSLSAESLDKRRLFSSNPQCIPSEHHNKSIMHGFESKKDANVVDSSVLCNSWPKPSYFEAMECLDRDHTYARGENSKTITKSDHAYFSQNSEDVGQEACHCPLPLCIHGELPENKVAIKFDHAYFDKPHNTQHNESVEEVTVKFDHAYFDHASSCVHDEKSSSLKTELSVPACDKLHLQEDRRRSFVKTDHAYFDKHNKVENLKTTVPKKSSVKPSSVKIVDSSKYKSRCDHNYYNGSVESLDMDLSASDTDSCDETNQEEMRLAFTAWCQLRKDHPYSTL